MKRFSCSRCMGTFSRKSSAKRHINSQHAGLAEIMDFKGFPVSAYNHSQSSKEAQEKITTTPGDLIFYEEYVRQLARILATEAFQTANESKENRARRRFQTFTEAISTFNNCKLGRFSMVSKDTEILFKEFGEK